MFYSLFVSWTFLSLVLPTTFSLSNNNPNAWKSRPLIPELAKSPPTTVTTTPTSDRDNDTKINKNVPRPAKQPDNQKREPWDFGRFLSQSSKFVTLPTLLPFMPKKTSRIVPGDILWKPSSLSSLSSSLPSSQGIKESVPKFTFAPLDDVVMGGVSSSSFSPLDGTWKGIVSDSNSGGFVGIRSTPFSNSLDMSLCQGIELTLRSNNRSSGAIFKAVVRDSTDFNGICWTMTFVSKEGGRNNNNNGVYTVKIPFEKLVPTIFARTVPGQRLKKSTIEGFQIAYSKFLLNGELNPKFELGDFQLDLLEIRAY